MLAQRLLNHSFTPFNPIFNKLNSIKPAKAKIADNAKIKPIKLLTSCGSLTPAECHITLRPGLVLQGASLGSLFMKRKGEAIIKTCHFPLCATAALYSSETIYHTPAFVA